jgi:RHS repeat-associated protein
MLLTSPVPPDVYWPNGNQKTRTTTAGTDSFTYDQENRLTQATIAGTTSVYTYNGDGLRMSSTVGTNPATNYVWDVSQSVPAVLQDGANTYVYGLGLISATDAASSQSYFLYDGLGSTTGLTNGSATLTDTYSYDVFGAVRSHSGSSTNYWQFTGQQSDSASNLYYLRARYYDPSIGRFLSRDPMPGLTTNPQSLNHYAYALNSPTNRVDPTGLDSEATPLSCVSLALLFASLGAIAIANPITSLVVSVALLGVAVAIDDYAHDHPGAVLDAATAYAFIVAALKQTLGGNLIRGLFVLDLVHFGPACVKYLTNGN